MIWNSEKKRKKQNIDSWRLNIKWVSWVEGKDWCKGKVEKADENIKEKVIRKISPKDW